MNDKYILDENHQLIECDDLMKWANWFENAKRRVAKTTLANDVMVSTVFLGLDHNFGKGTPILFETMIFGGEFDQEMDRYSTWDEAEKGHEKMVAKAKSHFYQHKEKRQSRL
ncbi:hypothetical protein LCGC14_0376030 [marine sediment metagenome]|uniref:Uncharacterized protein n=1 Tax=marine sediment metagenome TaxID=412755 RepID=A0A0F9T3T1_9ZZZZ